MRSIGIFVLACLTLVYASSHSGRAVAARVDEKPAFTCEQVDERFERCVGAKLGPAFGRECWILKGVNQSYGVALSCFSLVNF